MSNDKSQNLPKTERTPGNWKIDDADDLPLAIIEDTEDGLGIIEFCERTPQNIANAAFIVKACNNFEKMREILKEAFERLRVIDPIGYNPKLWIYDDGIPCSTLGKISALLAQIENDK